MAEKFRSYCDVRTRTWHVRRDQVAQRCAFGPAPTPAPLVHQ